jgi:mycothione reductase
MVHDLPVKGLARSQYWIHPSLAEVVENALLGLESALDG